MFNSKLHGSARSNISDPITMEHDNPTCKRTGKNVESFELSDIVATINPTLLLILIKMTDQQHGLSDIYDFTM